MCQEVSLKKHYLSCVSRDLPGRIAGMFQEGLYYTKTLRKEDALIPLLEELKLLWPQKSEQREVVRDRTDTQAGAPALEPGSPY